jgi:hypothetical protein
MTTSGGSAARPLAAAVLQVATAVAAHSAAAGCVPPAAALAVSLPVSLVGVLAVARLLRSFPLLGLGVGQLTVHTCLAASACTGAAVASHDPSGHGVPHVLMTAAHVGALLLCRATADLVLRSADRAAQALARLLRPGAPSCPRPPELPRARTAPRPGLLAQSPRHPGAPRRGPPAALVHLLPA